MALPKGLPSVGRLLTEQPFANDSSTERSGVPKDSAPIECTQCISLINPDSMACSWLRHIAIAVFIL